jgi:4-diphosphocytidyl-2-C-methyl-D-erythritol kinase
VTVQEFAPAKVNLGLAVLGRRPDGYHEIESLMVTVDVGDYIEAAATLGGVALSVEGSDLPSGPGNLAFRAAEAYLEAACRTGGVSLRLVKRLPIAAGLGGGSSDAAAVLRAMERLFPADLDLQAIALGLGADVPFLVEGGAAVARGVGEKITSSRVPPLHLVLANPGVAVSAADAYRGLNGRFGPPLDLEAVVTSLAVGTDPPYRNDLELPVLEAHPAIAEAKAILRDTGLRGVLMSGSGSTVFGLSPDRNGADRIAGEVAARQPGWWVRAASTISTAGVDR